MRGSSSRAASGGTVVAPIPVGKVLCVVTGIYRPDTPEEHVRQRLARTLMDDYGYAREDIAVEYTLKVGSKKGRQKPRLDLAVFRPGDPHEQAKVFIGIECKREDTPENDIKDGTEQLLYYMSACLNCRFGMWVGSSIRFFEKVASARSGEYEFNDASDVPRRGFDTPRPMKHSDLVPATEEDLMAVFRRSHNYIYSNQGLGKEQAFQEFLKLIFCKVYDEDRTGGVVRFYIGNEDRRSEIGQRKLADTIAALFADVKRRYPYIFGANERVELNNRVLAYLVTELQRFSLTDTPADAKGKAYEELVGTNLLGDRGEYFTPRNVCDMATRMVFATYPKEKWTELKVLDPACGTGGFLVSALNMLREAVHDDAQDRSTDLTHIETETARRVKEIATANLYGIDFNPVLARSAQMNMVMHGDGSTGVFHTDSLLPPGEWPREPPNDPYYKVKFGEFDICVTNPPFGANTPIDDPHIISQFEIAGEGMTRGRRRSMPPERLFVERCLKFLKPGGRLAIVLPDSILSNPGLTYLRGWILKNARVLASVSLPALTFMPQTGTKTSVLILQRKTPEEMKAETESGSAADYAVFMATPKAVGHGRRAGDVVFLRTPDGDTIEYKLKRRIIRRAPGGRFEEVTRSEPVKVKHDELPEVARSFEEWCREPSHVAEA